ncbi:ABC transporter permease, partial [Dickeya dadantii]|nr:ABC transporter permease [Dickeya dadantii]NPE69240.1 ABC transporter permease [Dickeya dadantii]
MRITYLATRLGQALLVLWAAFTLSFMLLQALPGDAVLIKFMSPELGLSAGQIAELRLAYGADVPLLTQYAASLSRLLHGDFGLSLQAGLPVSDLLATNLPPTLLLAVLGFGAALLLAFAL